MLQQSDTSPIFDTNWGGPQELKPHVYRNQLEKDIWMSVAVENEYGLEPLNENDVVIDIGANIGAFSHLAYRAGSRSIYAFEVDQKNIEAALQNLDGMSDGVALYNAAVVRSDEHRAKKYHYGGNWNCFGAVGPEVPSKSLDEIITEVGDPVRFLKIDCEGSEWPILYTCTKLDRVQEIAGEYHLGGHIVSQESEELRNLPYPISPPAMAAFLYGNGFAVELRESNEATGLFFARRTGLPKRNRTIDILDEIQGKLDDLRQHLASS